MTERLTEGEKQALKAAAFGAVYLVSNADDPGVVNAIRESFAASAALAGATGLVREILTGGELPKPAPGEASTVLPALRRSLAVLAAKAPEELESYRSTVLDAVDRVAGAVGGVTARESDLIARVKDALAG